MSSRKRPVDSSGESAPPLSAATFEHLHDCDVLPAMTTLMRHCWKNRAFGKKPRASKRRPECRRRRPMVFQALQELAMWACAVSSQSPDGGRFARTFSQGFSTSAAHSGRFLPTSRKRKMRGKGEEASPGKQISNWLRGFRRNEFNHAALGAAGWGSIAVRCRFAEMGPGANAAIAWQCARLFHCPRREVRSTGAILILGRASPYFPHSESFHARAHR